MFGPNADTENYPYFGSNFWQPWSKWSRYEYFTDDESFETAGQLDLEIHGGWSRAEPQKSFRLDFKSEYTGRMEASVYEQKPWIDAMNNINLRNGGQHVWASKIQDGFISQLINDTHADNTAYTPSLAYLNGEYWGVYGIREKVDEHYVEDNHDVPAEQVDLLNAWGALAGSDEHLVNSLSDLLSADPTSDEFYSQFQTAFDIENYIDYFAIETYTQNTDWLGIAWGINNVKLWRPQTDDGRWRYVVYDMDACFGFFGATPWQNYVDYARNPGWPSMHSDLFDHVLYNEQLACEFVNRYADLMNTIFQPDHFDQLLENTSSAIEEAMPDQLDTWYPETTMSDWQQSVDNISGYNAVRLEQAREQLIGEFDLVDQVDVTLDVFPSVGGKIHISTIIPENYPWEGVYYNGCPVTLTALPDPGFTFSHWEANEILGEDTYDQMITVNIFEDDNFTAVFNSNSSILQLEISEINYHSHDQLDAGDWVEIHNEAPTPLDLSYWSIEQGNGQFSFVFPFGTVLQADEYLVICADTSKFTTIHPDVDNYITGLNDLSNNSDLIAVLNNIGVGQIFVPYQDGGNWPQGADGKGRTLEYSGNGIPALGQSWINGCIGGSPGEAYSACQEIIEVSEIFKDPVYGSDPGDWMEFYNPSNSPLDIGGWTIVDANDNSYSIPEGAIIGPEDRLVLAQNGESFSSVYACHELLNWIGGFDFGLHGQEEAIYLFNSAGMLRYSFCYDIDSSWPEIIEGSGLSLERGSFANDVYAGDSWFTGCTLGSPTVPYSPLCNAGIQAEIISDNNMYSVEVSGGSSPYSIVWYVNGDFISGSDELIWNDGGSISATITDSNGCAGVASFEAPTSIVEEVAPTLSIYPNPARDFVTISAMDDAYVELIDVRGRICAQNKISAGRPWLLNTSGLSTGLYTVRARLDSGEVSRQKLMVIR